MVEMRRILCPVDFSESSIRAFEYALSLAERHGAELYMQHSIESWSDPLSVPPSSVFDEYRRTLTLEGETRLDRLIETQSHRSVQFKRFVKDGLPADDILAAAKEHAVDGIVMGTHGRRGLDRFMLGSVTERVLRHAPCPILAVRLTAGDRVDSDRADQPFPFRRILCCTDFSSLSEKAREHAASLAEIYGSELVLLHVLDERSDASTTVERTENAKRQLELRMAEVRSKPASVKTAVRLGRAYEQIIQVATEIEADLITVGVRGRNALDAAVFGSTAYRVIQLGPCPVLVIPA
jgi:nucleotide-binding universal stress UspA family protein